MAPPPGRRYGRANHKAGHQQKRHFTSEGNGTHENEENLVHDLTIAQQAAYAHIDFSMMQVQKDEESSSDSSDGSNSIPSSDSSDAEEAHESHKDNSKEIETEISENKEENVALASPKQTVEEDDVKIVEQTKTNEDPIEDDYESDIDLSEALAKMDQMEDVDEDDDKPKRKSGPKESTVSRGPVTANEIDPYDISHRNEQIPVAPKIDLVDISNLQLAGHIKSHVKADRVIVVESLYRAPALQDGNQLIVKLTDGGLKAGFTQTSELVPLGEVFEIFGPILQPLYTVRLPLPPNQIPNCNVQSKKDTGRKISVKNPSEDSVLKEEVNDKIVTEIGQDEIPTLLTTDNTADVPKSQMSHQIVAEETTCEDINVESEDLLSTIRLGAHVYFLKDGASWIDTNMVIRQSGRGCDASNIYDEELPPEDIEHSDDEEERRAKQSNKSRRRQNAEPNLSSQGKERQPRLPQNAVGQQASHNSKQMRQVFTQYSHQQMVIPQAHVFPYYPSYPAHVMPNVAHTTTLQPQEEEEEDTVYYNYGP